MMDSSSLDIAKYYAIKENVPVMATSPSIDFMGTGIVFTEATDGYVVPKGTIVRLIEVSRKVDPTMPYRIDADELRWENHIVCASVKDNYTYSFDFIGKFEDMLEEVPEETVKVLYGV